MLPDISDKTVGHIEILFEKYGTEEVFWQNRCREHDRFEVNESIGTVKTVGRKRTCRKCKGTGERKISVSGIRCDI